MIANLPMTLTLNKFRRQNCIIFMKQLLELKTKYDVGNFQNILEEIQHSFLVLINSFEIKPTPEAQLEKVGNDGEIEKIKIGNIVLYVHNYTVIDISDTHKELAKLFVNLDISLAIIQASLLWDYETRCCDKCGLYFRTPYFETPIIRAKEHDFVMAFHESCREI